MGLDVIEVVLDVGDTFGIKLDDSDASRIETVGQLYQYVHEKLGRRPPSPCPTATAFYRVRTALVDSGIASRRDVTPHMELIDWPAAAPQAWEFFLRTLDLQPIRPPLHPCEEQWLRVIGACTFMLNMLLFFVLVGSESLVVGYLWVGSLITLVLLTKRVQPRLPAECATVRGFVRHFETALAGQRDEMIWDKIVWIVSKSATNLPPGKIKPTSNLFGDLELG